MENEIAQNHSLLMVRQIKNNNWLYPRSRLIVRKEKHFFAIFSGFNKMKLHVKANDRN